MTEAEELELLELENKNAHASQSNHSQEQPSMADRAMGVLGTVANDPGVQMGLNVASGDIGNTLLAAKHIAQNPAETLRSPTVQAGLPIAGGVLGGPAGAVGGEAVRQIAGTALAPETVPQTAAGRAASMMGAGIAQDPKVLEAIPGVSKVGEMASSLASKVGSKIGGAATKTMQAFSGGKAQDFKEAALKGLSTYAAPSREEAGAAMGKIIEKLPGESIAPTMAEHIQSVITPESSSGSKFLVDIGKKLDAGELIDARQALKAKQSLDDVIDTVPIWQTKRRAKLFDLKQTFDDVLSNQSGALKDASNTYRAAALKDNMTKFLPVNKHGEYSRLAPMLTGLASSVGGTVGGMEGGSKYGALGALTPLATMIALSPGVLGGSAAVGGSAARQMVRWADDPTIRQVLLQTLERIKRNSGDGVHGE